LRLTGAGYVFDLDVRDYNLWMAEKMPEVLVLFDASCRRAYWVAVKDYFRDPARGPRRGAKTVRVRVARRQGFNRQAVAYLRGLKNHLYGRVKGGQP
jgi:hypothetical protein